MTDPLLRQTSFTYDEVGNLKTKTDPKSQLLTFTYDLANRLTQVGLPSQR